MTIKVSICNTDMHKKVIVTEFGLDRDTGRQTGYRNPVVRAFQVCNDHLKADWNQPALEGIDCVLCRLFYLEAQESLLEEWQQRAKRAEDAIAEVKRPLDEQMARLNQTVTRLNGELEAARSATAPIVRYTPVAPTEEQKQAAWSSGLANVGDARLIWVNEGDFWHWHAQHKEMLPVADGRKA